MMVVILLPTLHKLGVMLDFKINQDYITEVLCINKEEPLIMCSGKCYLSDQLQKAEEQEQKQAPNGQQDKLETVYYHASPTTTGCLLPGVLPVKVPAPGHLLVYSSSFIDETFHPPELYLR